jgi:uncharacterized protein (DUF1501 family)
MISASLLTYNSDAISGFMQDMERLGRADDVTVMVFSEFGRRVPENTSLGTDVYATMAEGWLQHKPNTSLLNGAFKPLEKFA